MALRRIHYSLFVLLLIAASPLALHAQWMRTNGPYGGRITDLVASGTTLFAGTLGGGVFRSTDNGTSWNEASHGLTDFDVYVLAVSGTTLFAGFEKGIFRSTDNGNHWVNLQSPIAGNKVQSIAVVGSAIITATENNGMYRSTDNGEHWTMLSVGLPEALFGSPVNCLEVNEGTIFLSLHTGILRSVDSGASWTQVDGTSDLSSLKTLAFIDRTILVATDYHGMLSFTDNGNRWAQRGDTSLTDTVANDLLVHGATLFAGTWSGVCRSSDGGVTWSASSPDIGHRSIQCLATIGNTIFAGGWGSGIYRSSDNGATWVEANNGLSATAINKLFVHDGCVFAAGTFMSSVCRTSNGGTEWINDDSYDPDLNDVLILGDTIYVAGGEDVISRSTDNGVTWQQTSSDLANAIVSAIVDSDSYLFAAAPSQGVFLMTPEMDTSTALAGVLRSSDHGATWWEVNQGFEVSEGFNGDRLPAVTSLLVKGDVLLAGTDHGLYRSSDNGDQWAALNDNFPNDLFRYIGEMATNGSTIVIARHKGLYSSSDDGLTWSCIDPNISVGAITAAGNDFFCSASISVRNAEAGTYILRSSDNGATWTSINEGIQGNVYGWSLAATTTDLYLGTSGRGVWRRPLSEIVSHLNPGYSLAVAGGDGITVAPYSADSSITLSYRLGMRVCVSITICDSDDTTIVLQPVVDEMQNAGEHQIMVNTKAFREGYFRCIVQAGDVKREDWFTVRR
jgi:photosystem II stability/assembly factor-like uncharacterized protein